MNEPSQSIDHEAAIAALTGEIVELKRIIESQNKQLNWFQRHLFGRRSEKLQTPIPEQGLLFPPDADLIEAPSPTVTVPAHERRKRHFPGTPDDSGLRFDESKVPVKIIDVVPDELKGLAASEYEVIRQETTYRLAQRPASYVVLKFVRPILKHRPSRTLITTPAPASVFDKSVADVSFLANVIIDKLVYHLPLYRQHQRLCAGHIELARSTLTNLMNRAGALLEPIAVAVLDSVLQSRVLAMDETPTRAGRTKDKGARHGKMKIGYYWPLMGDRDEIYFSFAATRGERHIHTLLTGFEGKLLSDGYSAYAGYVAKIDGVTHAQCWAHSRRNFEQAVDNEPELATEALHFIAALYVIEKRIREKGLLNSDKLAYRAEHCKQIVADFMAWCRQVAQRQDLIAIESPVVQAANYVIKRAQPLQVFLEDPEVAIDTNHLERALRVIPMGRRAWLFSWTEVGAHRVGILQTLLATCKLQGVDPYTYLVDVLQRIDTHPARDVDQLTPRLWKEHFAENPLRSYIDTS